MRYISLKKIMVGKKIAVGLGRYRLVKERLKFFDKFMSRRALS